MSYTYTCAVPGTGITESYFRSCNVCYVTFDSDDFLIPSIFIRSSRCRCALMSIKMPSVEAYNNFARYYGDNTICHRELHFAVWDWNRGASPRMTWQMGTAQTAYVCALSQRRSIVQRTDKRDSNASASAAHSRRAVWIHVFLIYSENA